MKYEDAACSWNDLTTKDAFSIERHTLKITQPLRYGSDGSVSLDCTLGGDDGRRFGRIDFSKGFSFWWFLSHIDFKVPSEHTQEGKRYSAELQMAHFFSVSGEEAGVDNEMAHVSIFLEAVDDFPPYPHLDRLICEWRKAEDKTREECGLPSVGPYPGCYNPARGHTSFPSDAPVTPTNAPNAPTIAPLPTEPSIPPVSIPGAPTPPPVDSTASPVATPAPTLSLSTAIPSLTPIAKPPPSPFPTIPTTTDPAVLLTLAPVMAPASAPTADGSVTEAPVVVIESSQPSGGTTATPVSSAGASASQQPSAGASASQQPSAGASASQQPSTGTSASQQPSAVVFASPEPSAGTSASPQPSDGTSVSPQPSTETTTQPTTGTTSKPTTESTPKPTTESTAKPTPEPTTASTSKTTPEPTTASTSKPTTETTSKPTIKPTPSPMDAVRYLRTSVHDVIVENSKVPQDAMKRLVLDEENFRPADKSDEEWAEWVEAYSAHDQGEASHEQQRKLLQGDYLSFHNYQFLIDVRTEYYYRYSGTSTVPPCYAKFVGGTRGQTNHWRVLKDPIRVHPRQIAEMERLLRERIAPTDANAKACENDTAGKVDADGHISVARPLQQFHHVHYKTFCECDDWQSKWPEDRAWCQLNQGDKSTRFYEHPYNFDSQESFAQ